MTGNEFESQLQADCESLRELVAGLDRLELQLDDARATIQARRRGYFTPDEDDRVRQMLLAYRNYRRALYEIIERYAGYEEMAEPAHRLRGFMVAFAAALTLSAKSLRLIQAYEHEPLIRQKLNEPEAKFELESGFFDEILSAYSSPQNYRLLVRANRFWRGQRRTIQQLKLADTPDWASLCGVIRHQRAVMHQRFRMVLWLRLRHDWRTLWRMTLKPVQQTRYGLQALLGGTFAALRTTRHYEPGIDTTVLEHLRGVLCPGDVLLVRTERKVTTALLPGFWAHAALYVGGQRDLTALGLQTLPQVRKHWDAIPPDGGRFGHVIEAINPRVLITPLERSLCADHVVVLRPNVSEPELAAALAEAFSHVGKPYDFEFDFNVTSRIVCTELIYRSFHRRAGIEFSLIKRLGRYTLSGDDIMHQFLETLGRSAAPEHAPFHLVALALKHAGARTRVVPEPAQLESLRRIQGGARPVSAEPFFNPNLVSSHD